MRNINYVRGKLLALLAILLISSFLIGSTVFAHTVSADKYVQWTEDPAITKYGYAGAFLKSLSSTLWNVIHEHVWFQYYQTEAQSITSLLIYGPKSLLDRVKSASPSPITRFIPIGNDPPKRIASLFNRSIGVITAAIFVAITTMGSMQ